MILLQLMCQRQRAHLLQVAFWRFRLDRMRQRQGWGIGDPQNPRDPYRGWDDFFWLDHFDGPRTVEEEWVLRSLRSINFHDQAVGQAERDIQAEQEYAERERRRLQPDYEAFLANVALRGLVPRRLERIEDSEVEDSDSSDPESTLQWGVYREGHEWRLGVGRQPTNQEFPGRFAEVQAPAGGYSPIAETHGHVANMMIAQTLRWQAEAELEAYDARAASDAAWLEQTLRWHEESRREQEERDALSDEEWL